MKPARRAAAMTVATIFKTVQRFPFNFMDLGLNGKLALVTGSTTGIGAAIAEGLARECARVIVNGRTEYRVQKGAEGD